MSDDDLKRSAGVLAADLVEPGMVVGLGTGSTASHAIRRLGERVSRGLLMTGIPTSVQSERLAREVGVPLVTFDDADRLDLTIDGADEVDPHGNLIKGGGGALLREKVVAHCSAVVVIVVDPGKIVETLGLAFRLPVEIVPFARAPVGAAIRCLGGEDALRTDAEAKPFVTDNGNWILDVDFSTGIPDPGKLEATLDQIPGIVESGLFVGLMHRLVIGRHSGPELREFH